MANSQLIDKKYQIPKNILEYIQKVIISYPNSNGIKRAKFIVNNGSLTYQALKGMKNFFDYFNPNVNDKTQYELAGGDLMKSFIENTLNSDRKNVQLSKEVKRDANVDVNLGNRAYQTPRLNETDKDDDKEITKNSLVVIVNDDNKFLLLKRSSNIDWMPNKLALVGGRIEKNESPEEAAIREVEEETGIDIDKDKLIKSFEIERTDKDLDYIFLYRFDGEPTEIELNNEHSTYGWYDVSEIKFLDVVPNLMSYIDIAFKKQ
jgi:mutator protein MutT